MRSEIQSSDSAPVSLPPAEHGWFVVAIKAAATLLVLACYTIYLNAVPDYRSDQADDSFTYFELAKAMQDGAYPTKHWMPGFPAALSVLIRCIGYDFQGLKLAMAGTAAVAAAASYMLYRRLFGPDAAFALAALLMFVPAFFDYSHRVMSEVPCLAATMICLACLEQLRRSTTKTVARTCGIGLCVSAVIALAIRGNALALIPAMGAAAVFPGTAANERARMKLAAIVAIVAATSFYGLWMLRNSHREFSGIDNVTYLEEIQAEGSLDVLWSEGGLTPAVERVTTLGMLRRLARNLAWGQVYRISDCVLPGSYRLKDVRSSRIGTMLAIVLSIPVIVGSFTLFRSSPSCSIYLACSLGLIAVYPTGNSVRMLIPSLGVIVPAAYSGLRTLFGRRFAMSWACVAVVAGAATCVQEADQQQRRPYSDDRLAGVLKAIHAAEKLTQPDDIVIMPAFGQVARAITSLRIVTAESSEFRKSIQESSGVVAIFHETDRNTLDLLLTRESKVLWSGEAASVVRLR